MQTEVNHMKSCKSFNWKGKYNNQIMLQIMKQALKKKFEISLFESPDYLPLKTIRHWVHLIVSLIRLFTRHRGFCKTELHTPSSQGCVFEDLHEHSGTGYPTIRAVGQHQTSPTHLEAKARTHVDSCSWCTTPCTARRGRRPRRRWSPHTASCCCTTCTQSCHSCTHHTWCAGRRACGTAWRCGWLWEEVKVSCEPKTHR